MASSNDLKRGMRIELDGDPWIVVDQNMQTASGRGSKTLIKTKLRNLRTGQLADRAFQAGERVKLPDFEIRECQYLYDDGQDSHTFMDSETYEQFTLNRDEIEYELGFVRPNDSLRAMMFEGRCIGLELPHTVVLEVVDCEPAVKGDTATAVFKAARMDTGLEVQVPIFIATGEKLVIDTRDCRYVRRA